MTIGDSTIHGQSDLGECEAGAAEFPVSSTAPKVADQPPASETKVDRLLEMLQESVSALAKQFDERITSDATKNQAFDRLYKELDERRAGWLYDQLKPFFLDLIHLHDRVSRLLLESKDHVGGIGSISEELLDVLQRREIERISVGKNFNPSQHRAVRMVETDSNDGDGMIVEVVRDGFIYQGRVVRYADVVIKKKLH